MLAWETRRLVETSVNAAKPTFGSSAIFSSGSSLDLEFAFGEYWDHGEFEKYIDIKSGLVKCQIDVDP